MSRDGPLGFDPDPADEGAAPRSSPATWPPPAPSGPAAPPRRPPRPPGAAGRPGVLVGLAALVLLAVAGVGALRARSDVRPARLAAGDPAPPFATPLASSRDEGDANVATPQTVGEEAGRVPACRVRRPDVLNACALWERRPLALVFFSERARDCAGEVDRLQAAARRHPRVAIAAVAIRGDRERVREAVRVRGWSLPVGIDRDGILAGLYGVAVCPQVAFVARGGRIAATSVGTSSPAELDRRLAALAR